MVHGENIVVKTQGESDIVNITQHIQEVVSRSTITNGVVVVFAIGSTASISTIEFEPALVHDFKDHLEKFAPSSMHSRHSQTWGDDNGYSHIRATFMGPTITVPLADGNLTLGTWQQIVVIDHDNRPRKREIRIQILGE